MRLIDAYKIDIDRDCYDTYADYIRAFDTINEAPTVDALVITRCKDCKYHQEAHYEEDGEDPIIKHKCKLMKGYQFSENHYCGFAERKEDD